MRQGVEDEPCCTMVRIVLTQSLGNSGAPTMTNPRRVSANQKGAGVITRLGTGLRRSGQKTVPYSNQTFGIDLHEHPSVLKIALLPAAKFACYPAAPAP